MKIHLFLITSVMVCGLISCSKKSTEPFGNTVSTPTISLPSGLYHPSNAVTISCSTPETVIRYTLDGSVPTTRSNLYSAPLLIDSTLTLKVVAWKHGYNQSAIATADYEIIPSGLAAMEIASISASPDTIFADNGVTFSTVTVNVRDADQMNLPGQNVLFVTDLGHVLNIAVTDSSGIARTTLWAEDVAGMATVTAIVRKYHPEHPDFLLAADTASVNVTIAEIPPSIVHSLQFTQSGQIDLNISNTGGVESYIMRVRLLDEAGHLVTGQHQVWFRILNANPPLGANLNGYFNLDSLWVYSDNGIAQVTVNSGTLVETLTVRASCTEAGHYIYGDKENIVVHSGPPHRIEVFAGGNNSCENMGYGIWLILVGARVYDIYNNPVDYGTSVLFQIPENPYNCQIGAGAYIGNESVYGDSTAGTAYSWLTYFGDYSLLEIGIRAITGGINGQEVFGEADIVLPLNQPELEVVIIPGNLVFHGNVNPTPSSQTAVLNANVFDGQGCRIRYATVSLSDDYQYGYFEYTPGTNTDPEHYNPIDYPNVIVTDIGGEATGQMRFYPDGIPLEEIITGMQGILPVIITGNLLGTNVTSKTSITLIRYGT